MHNLLETVQEKNSLLRSIAGSGNEQLPHVIQDWEKFELMFDSHQLMIKDQVSFPFLLPKYVTQYKLLKNHR